MGETVFGGDPNAAPGTPAYDAYNNGVHAGSLANGIMACINVGVSFLLPLLTKWFGMKPVYVTAQFFAGISLLACWWVKNEWTAIALISLSGTTWSMNGTFPYIILTNYVKLAHRGTAVGII